MVAGQQLVVFSWVIPILLCLVLVVLLVLCTCFGKSKKSVTYGTTGGPSFPSNPSALHTEGLEANGHMIIPAPDDTVSLDPKARTKDRALPDIPMPVTTRSSTSESNPDSVADNTSDSYATVTKGVVNPIKPRNHRRNKPKAPKPPGMNELTISVTPEPDGRPHSAPMTPATSENTSREFLRPSSLVQVVNLSVSNVNGSRAPSIRYSLLQGYTELDNRNTGVNHSQSASSKGPIQPEFSACEPSTSEQPCGDTVDSESFVMSQPAGLLLSVDAEGRSRNPSTAGQAVAGQIPSAEIPYMTPPLQHSPLMTNMEDGGEISSGNKDTPYNMISVREPLAKVREETLKLQLRQQPGTSSNQVSGSQSSEGHYMVVPDEEEMYEEIDPGSSQHSERSSSMYASIEPERRQLPPAPPTVESLKCVAQAHSRQASYTSATSFDISDVMGTTEDDANQLMKDLSGLYSVVDKSGKQRQTIHLAEGVSFLPSSKDEPQTVEEMYAKVHKKRHGSSSSASGMEEIGKYSYPPSVDVFAPPVPPKSPTVVTDFPLDPSPTTRRHVVNSAVLPVANSIIMFSPRPHSTDIVTRDDDDDGEDSDPGYEPVKHQSLATNDPDYEPLKHQKYTSNNPSYESLKYKKYTSNDPGYESVKDKKHASNDPDYGLVKQKKYVVNDPGYESVKQKKHASNDPGYESVKDKKYVSNDPGYESVKQKKYASNDPGYESVKDKKHASNDPGYESVKDKKHASNDPGYESVKDKKYGSNDPGYESVKQKKYASNDPGYERVKGDLDDLRYENVAQPAVAGKSLNGFTWESPANNMTHMPQDQTLRHHGYESLKGLHRNDSDATESYYEKVRPRGYDSNSEFGDPDYEPVRRHESERADPNYEKIRRLARTESDVTDPGYECVKKPPLPPLNAATSHEPPYEIVHGAESDVSEPGYESVHHQDHGKHQSTSGHVVEEFFNYLIDPSSKVEGLTFSYPDYEMVKHMHSNTPNRSDDSEEFYETIPSKDRSESHVLETVPQLTDYNPDEDRGSKICSGGRSNDSKVKDEQENSIPVSSHVTKMEQTKPEESTIKVGATREVEEYPKWDSGPVEV